MGVAEPVSYGISLYTERGWLDYLWAQFVVPLKNQTNQPKQSPTRYDDVNLFGKLDYRMFGFKYWVLL